ncbi:MAG: hypothetical protein AAFX51_17250, partial [Cyanobacteria bacterium J06636_28]
MFAADATDVAESSTTDAMADDTALTTDIDEPTGQLPETAEAQVVTLQPDGATELADSAVETAPNELQVAQA